MLLSSEHNLWWLILDQVDGCCCINRLTTASCLLQLMRHKRPAVPIFASQLGLLEPSRGQLTKKEDQQQVEGAIGSGGTDATAVSNASGLPASTPQVCVLWILFRLLTWINNNNIITYQ